MTSFYVNNRRIIALCVAFVCVLALLPLKVNAADTVEVFRNGVRANDNKVYGVRVATGKSLTNIKIGAERIREAGYNAYIYEDMVKASDSNCYCIMIGVFENEEDAEELLREVWNGPKVRGVDMEDAYISKAYISDYGMEKFAYPYTDDEMSQTEESNSKTTSSNETKTSPPEKVEVFYKDVRANDNKVYGVRVGTGKNLTNIKIGAERVRDAGFNAYIYEDMVKASDSNCYCIMIGVFENEEDAEELLREVWNGPKVRGIKMENAYISYAYISDIGVDLYSDWYY